MYRTGKKNAVKNVHNNYNEYSEFHARESEKVIDIVNKTAELDEKMKSPFACRADGCNKSYLSHFARVRHEIGKHKFVIARFEEINDERDPMGYYFCQCGCAFVFSTRATRN
ncbi:hypothetical protein AC249_AIPGENE23165, partial [Paramuricea clavata]